MSWIAEAHADWHTVNGWNVVCPLDCGAGEDYDHDDDNDCPGHESLDGAHMGETVYCDGTCVPAPTCANCDGPLHTGYDYCETCRTLTGKDYQ